MSNDVSQKCVPPQKWPTTQDANGVITSAGPPITALNRIRYKCETSHSREETDMRRKAEVLQYKKNSFKWTKKERFAYLAKHPSSRPPTNSIQPAPTGANRSLSPMGISVLRAINEKAAQHNVKRPASIRRAFENNATGQKWVPSTTDRSAVDQHYKSEIEEVASIFGMGPADCRIIHDWFSESDHPTKPLSAKEILETGVGEMADAILEISNSNRRGVLKPIA